MLAFHGELLLKVSRLQPFTPPSRSGWGRCLSGEVNTTSTVPLPKTAVPLTAIWSL
jgi:hypothetical protein